MIVNMFFIINPIIRGLSIINYSDLIDAPKINYDLALNFILLVKMGGWNTYLKSMRCFLLLK